VAPNRPSQPRLADFCTGDWIQLFCLVFRWCLGASFCATLAEIGAILEPFGRLFVIFWRFVGFGWMPLPLKRKPIFSGFGGPMPALVSPLFQVRISGCVFNGLYADFCDFGSPLGSLLAPFGPQRLGESAIQFRIGEKVASRVATETLLDAFLAPCGRILGNISEGLGRNLTTPFLSMP